MLSAFLNASFQLCCSLDPPSALCSVQGNFLVNCEFDRQRTGIPERTSSIWAAVNARVADFRNPLFVDSTQTASTAAANAPKSKHHSRSPSRMTESSRARSRGSSAAAQPAAAAPAASSSATVETKQPIAAGATAAASAGANGATTGAELKVNMHAADEKLAQSPSQANGTASTTAATPANAADDSNRDRASSLQSDGWDEGDEDLLDGDEASAVTPLTLKVVFSFDIVWRCSLFSSSLNNCSLELCSG